MRDPRLHCPRGPQRKSRQTYPRSQRRYLLIRSHCSYNVLSSLLRFLHQSLFTYTGNIK
jgi:hypothetical protein